MCSTFVRLRIDLGVQLIVILLFKLSRGGFVEVSNPNVLPESRILSCVIETTGGTGVGSDGNQSGTAYSLAQVPRFCRKPDPHHPECLPHVVPVVSL